MSRKELTLGHTLRNFRLPGAVRIDTILSTDEHDAQVEGLSSQEGAGSWKVDKQPATKDLVAPYSWRSYEFEVAVRALIQDERKHELSTRDVRFNDLGAHVESRVADSEEKWRFLVFAHPEGADTIELDARDLEQLRAGGIYRACLVAITTDGQAEDIDYILPEAFEGQVPGSINLSDLYAHRAETTHWVARIAQEYAPRIALFDTNSAERLPFKLGSACALRFMGHEYRNDHGYVDDLVFDTYFQHGRLVGSTLDKWTTFLSCSAVWAVADWSDRAKEAAIITSSTNSF